MQGGSTRNSWLCLQTMLPSLEEICPGPSVWRLQKPWSAAGHSPPLQLTSSAPPCIQHSPPGSPGLFSRATSSGFSASRVVLASPRTGRNSRVCSHVTLWRDRETTPLCPYIVLEKPKSCAITWLPVPRAAGSPAEESWQNFQLQSQHPVAGHRGSGHCWCPQGLSSTGASPWVSLPDAEQWPPKMYGAAPRG